MNPAPKTPIHLVLNCSESILQVVLGNRDQVFWSQNIMIPGRAMKHIAPAIKAGLDCLEIQPCNLAGISCPQGPGSFTGIRMIFAHAHGIALTAKIPMSVFSTFEALIDGPGHLLHGPAWIFIHSRQGQVYAMGFSLPSLKPLASPANIDIKKVLHLVNPVQGRAVHVFGSGVRKNPEYFTADCWNVLPETWDTPLPQSLLRMGIQAPYTTRPSFPEYLRPSDAEEKSANTLN